MKISLLFFLLVFLSTDIIAQHRGKISGHIQKENMPAEGFTVNLLRSTDSSIVQLTATGSEGQYVFESIAAGNYLLSLTAVGYKKTYSPAITISPELQEVN